MLQFEKLLSGNDLRSIGNSNSVVLKVRDQNDFDELFKCLLLQDRIIVMRAADVIEKVTLQHPEYLISHKSALLKLCVEAKNKELKWHLAQLIPRLNLSTKDLNTAWQILSGWALNKKESKIVRVNSIQALFEISLHQKIFINNLRQLFSEIEKENIPSINARIRKLKFLNIS